MKLFRAMAAAILMVSALGCPPAPAAEEPLPTAIAEVGDPPPALDGELGRLLRVPGWIDVRGKAAVGFGAETWRDDADLSGALVLGWEPSALYVGARVSDSVVSQPFAGEALWQGDHVMLLLDVPRQEGVRDKGKVVQTGISPGDLQPGGLPPEVFQWTPQRRSVVGARVGARRTPDGYQIEAAIPWRSLGLEAVDRGLRLGFDPFEFRFDVTGLWLPAGGNRIEIGNTAEAYYPLVAEVGVGERLSAPPHLTGSAGGLDEGLPMPSATEPTCRALSVVGCGGPPGQRHGRSAVARAAPSGGLAQATGSAHGRWPYRRQATVPATSAPA